MSKVTPKRVWFLIKDESRLVECMKVVEWHGRWSLLGFSKCSFLKADCFPAESVAAERGVFDPPKGRGSWMRGGARLGGCSPQDG